MKLFKLFAAAVLAVTLIGCGGVSVYNVYDKPTNNSHELTLSEDEVKQAIIMGGESKDWQMADKGYGLIVATQNTKGLIAVVDITYDEKSFSINYKDSHGFGYDPTADTIKKRYNRWIANLDRAIQTSMKQIRTIRKFQKS